MGAYLVAEQIREEIFCSTAFHTLLLWSPLGRSSSHIPVPSRQEMCSGGDWFDRLLKNGPHTEGTLSRTARVMLETLSFCHSLGVVHRSG